jgi:hypothetical protein
MQQFRLARLVLAATMMILVCRFIALPGTAAAQGVTSLSFGSPPHGGPMPSTPATGQVRQVFQNIGCQACHIITQTTGQSENASQSNVSFTPLSDFALDDMGIGQADGIRHAGKTDAGRCSKWQCEIGCHRR